MKHFKIRLVFLAAVALILCATLAACGKRDTAPPSTPEPETGPKYDTPVNDTPEAAFFNELYNVSRGIGIQKIEDGENVYLNADFSLAFGSRSKDKSINSQGFVLDVNAEGVVDRTGGDNTAIKLAFSSGDVPIANACFIAKDDMLYLQLGDKKLKINAKLAKFGDVISAALNLPIKGKDANGDEKQFASAAQFINDMAATTGDDWTLDVLINGILNAYGGLKPKISAALKQFGFITDDGNVDLRKMLRSNILLGCVTAKVDGNRYQAVVNQQILQLLADKLGMAADDKLNVSAAFSATNHKLLDGVKATADFIVGDNNALNNSLAQSNGKKLYPYFELTINALKIGKADDKQAIYDVNAEDYSDNLQLDITEKLEVKGLQLIVPDTGIRLPKLEMRMLATLDLANEGDANKTAIRAYLSTTYAEEKSENSGGDVKYSYPETTKNLCELTYVDKRLSYVVDNNVPLIKRAFDNFYSLIAPPLGNVIEGALEKISPEQAAAFSDRYWSKKPVVGKDGKKSGGKYNANFRGMVIDNVSPEDILGVIFGKLTQNEGGENDNATSSEAPQKSYYNGVAKILTLLCSRDGKPSVKAHDLLDTVCVLASYFGKPLEKQGVIDSILGYIRGGSLSILDSNGMVNVDGSGKLSLADNLNYLFDAPNADENNLTIDFDFANGLEWQLYWLRHGRISDPTYNANGKLTSNGQDEVSLKYVSSIKFATPVEIKGGDFAEMFAAIDNYNANISDYEQTRDDAKRQLDEKIAALKAAENVFWDANADYKTKKQQYESALSTSAADVASMSYLCGASWTNVNIMLQRIYKTADEKSKLFLWVKAGELESGKEKDDYDQAVANFKNYVNTSAALKSMSAEAKQRVCDLLDNSVLPDFIAESKAYIANNAAEAAAKASETGIALANAESAKSAAQTVYDNAENAVKKLKNTYLAWLYWDIKPTKQ